MNVSFSKGLKKEIMDKMERLAKPNVPDYDNFVASLEKEINDLTNEKEEPHEDVMNDFAFVV
jgi:hypothetical protein